MFVLLYASAKENASWRPKVDFDTGQGWKTVQKRGLAELLPWSSAVLLLPFRNVRSKT